jgi:hypothetical protein
MIRPFFSTLAKMLRQPRDELLRRHGKRVADPEQRDEGARSPSFDHLPVADGKAVADHILLGKLALHPVRPDFMAQGAEEPRVTDRKLSAGAHVLMLLAPRAKTPRAKMRVVIMYDAPQRGYGRVALGREA